MREEFTIFLDFRIMHSKFQSFFLGTKGFMGEPAVSPTYCPINGAYQFTYSVKDGTECSAYTSDISDCPYGYGFNLKFNGCSFGDMDMAFHCLGNFTFSFLFNFQFFLFEGSLEHSGRIWRFLPSTIETTMDGFLV